VKDLIAARLAAGGQILFEIDDVSYGAGFGRKLQLAQFAYVTNSEAAARSLAENYVGFPFDRDPP
jgi:hypothetical protein